MALGGEPKNGDYARYVEELSRSGASGLPSAPSPEATRSPGATSGSASSSASRCRPRPGAMAARRPRRSPGDARKPGKPPAGKLPPLKSTYRKDG